MKILLSTTALTLALGFSTVGIAMPYTSYDVVPPSLAEVAPSVVLDITSDFYQGDFLVATRASLEKLTQNDLYTGKGASEMNISRWVT